LSFILKLYPLELTIKNTTNYQELSGITMFTTTKSDKKLLEEALNSNIKDFEDEVQYFIALNFIIELSKEVHKVF
jgi:hypothetical protein